MRVISAMAVLLLIASAAQAGDPVDECRSSAGLSCSSMKIRVCPQGDFDMIKRACGGTGDYIWVEVWGVCEPSFPIAGIPQTDFWFDACDAPLEFFLCTAGIVADSLTGVNGRTTFSGAIRAGGCVLSGGIWIAVQGRVIFDECGVSALCLPIVIKSPDLTGAGGYPDGIVDLSDMVPFGTSYNRNYGQTGYNACCDYNGDDKCNLSDFAYFALHYQHACR
jgi:hypothetical protein